MALKITEQTKRCGTECCPVVLGLKYRKVWDSVPTLNIWPEIVCQPWTFDIEIIVSVVAEISSTMEARKRVVIVTGKNFLHFTQLKSLYQQFWDPSTISGGRCSWLSPLTTSYHHSLFTKTYQDALWIGLNPRYKLRPQVMFRGRSTCPSLVDW